MGRFFLWRIMYSPPLYVGNKNKCYERGNVTMLSINENGYLTIDGRRMKCRKTGAFLKKEDLRTPVPEGLSDSSLSSFIRQNLYLDAGGRYFCKAEGEKLKKCFRCGKWYLPEDMKEHEGHFYCESCFDYNFRTCAHCGRVFERSVGTSWIVNTGVRTNQEQWLCNECTGHGYFGDDTRGHYLQCCECGDIMLRENAVRWQRDHRYVCPRCHDRLKNRALFSYHYSSTPGYGMDFLGIETRKVYPLMGVELEIDEGGENNTNAKKVRDAIGFNRVTCTTDGSLRNGFEIVSCPANLKHHLTTLKWEEGMKVAKELGYVSHDGGRCGLHVHIDRKFFENQLKDDIEAKFFIILRNNLSWIRTFSRRYAWGYCQINGYEHAEDGSGDSLGAITYPPDKVWLKGKKQSGRHMALNFYPENTIEIRIFRGTLNYNTFKATLQFVDMWANFAKATSLNNIVRISLTHFVNAAQNKGYREFLGYLAERKIIEDGTKTGE